MAVRARLAAPRAPQHDWRWHRVKSVSLPSEMLFLGDRRFEAENYLANGFATRRAIEVKLSGWTIFENLASTTLPNRLKGVVVSSDTGTPYLAATQVFDAYPISRKWLALEKSGDLQTRFVKSGTILVTRSGAVGRSIVATKSLEHFIISDDLLRVAPKSESHAGWIYAYLRSPTVRAMMVSAQYGHIIKHLEVAHLAAMPILLASDDVLSNCNDKFRRLIELRVNYKKLTERARSRFEAYFDGSPVVEDQKIGFDVSLLSRIALGRRRLDAAFHNPQVSSLMKYMEARAIGWDTLETLKCRVWLPSRFKRVPAEDGVPFLDSADLFELNPDITKKIRDSDFGDPYRARTMAGWLLLSRSGQVYGLNGSMVIASARIEGKVISDHIIRICPNKESCRAGYILTALTHPTLGMPRVKALPYGSSIPEIEIEDIKNIPIPRLPQSIEQAIAGDAEAAAHHRDEADHLENELAEIAEEQVVRFLSSGT